MKKLLFITQHLPYPPFSGARRREYELLKHITKHIKVVLLCVSKVYEEDKDMINCMDLQVEKVYLYPANPIKSIAEANAENISIQVFRNASNFARIKIIEIIRKHAINVIHIEGFYMYNILPPNMSVPVVLCEQNIEYDIWAQQAKINPIYREQYIEQMKIVKYQEEKVWENVSSIVAVTDIDAKVIREKGMHCTISIVSNGYNHSPILKESQKNNDDIYIDKHYCNLLFVGNYDYKPNEDAAFYFVNDILPLLNKKIKNLRVYFVGNIGGANVEKLKSEKVIITGRVHNLDYFYKYADIFICPLRYGGGIKTKMLEALYSGKPIITTSVGLQGIVEPADSPFIVADSPEKFVDGIMKLMSDTQFRKMKENNCKNVLSSWMTWEAVAYSLYKIYECAMINCEPNITVK